jgi:hypothetical protein
VHPEAVHKNTWLEFQVKWKGYPLSHDKSDWVKEKDLACRQLVCKTLLDVSVDIYSQLSSVSALRPHPFTCPKVLGSTPNLTLISRILTFVLAQQHHFDLSLQFVRQQIGVVMASGAATNCTPRGSD